MLNKVWILGIVFLIGAVFLTVDDAMAEGYAVLVGINDYLVISPDLNYCESDALLMRETLINKAGFRPENIKMLLSKEATKRNIMFSITRWLKDNVKPGDKAIFYFSGHGIQLEDDNGDESDGKDELLCAYDSTLYDITFIRDDELDRWFRKLNTKDKMVILDCCHSGTATKDVSIWNTVKEYYPAPSEPIEMVRGADLLKFKEYLDEDQLSSTKAAILPPDVQFENTVLISACDAHQVAIESSKTKHGLLTYYLTQGLTGDADVNGDKVLTVEEVASFATKNIKAEGWEQNPQLEGDYVGKTFVGSLEPEVSYAFVKSIAGQSIKVSIGKSDDVVKGAIYQTFAAQETDMSGTGKGKIKIIDVGEDESTATLIEGTVDAGDKIVLYAKPIDSKKLLVFVEDPTTMEGVPTQAAARLKTSMNAALRSEDFIDIVSKDIVPDKIIRTEIKAGSDPSTLKITMRVVNVNLSKSWQPYEIETSLAGINQSGRKLISAAIENELKSGYVVKNLQNLKNQDSSFRINLSVDKEAYEIGDVVTITVQPTQNCYLTLIDITTSGKAYVLFPNEFEGSNLIKKDQKFSVPSVGTYQIQVSGPAGIEMVKAIATTEPLDLSSLNPDDPNSPIKFFSSDNLFQISDLPSKDLTLKPVSQWATETITFKIGDKNIYKEDREPLLLSQLE